MRIGVIELMETGHIVMAETIARIFSSEKSNSVTIYTTGKHADNLQHLNEFSPNLKIISKPAEQHLPAFLKKISETKYDRLYIVTMSRYFPLFARWEPGSPLFLVIHNLEEWFGFSYFERARKFFNAVKQTADTRSLIYLFKLYFIYPSYKSTIIKKVIRAGGKVVILSDSVQSQLKAINKDVPSEVIPFSVNDPFLAGSLHAESGILRICVPGVLSQYRRDYLGLLAIMEEQLFSLKEMFSVDFLGGIQPANPLNKSEAIVKRTEELINKGYSISLHRTEFIPPREYDMKLAGCDIILGNMHIVLSKFSVYGKTKETGLPFAMIKAGKPGILPSGYTFPGELASQVITYRSLAELGSILKAMIKNRNTLRDLQESAKVNSQLFSPEKIYSKLLSIPAESK